MKTKTILIKIKRKILFIINSKKIECRFEKKEVHINGWSKFGARVSVGKNVNFNGVRTYGRGIVYIGDNFHSAAGLRILTQTHNYKGEKLPYDEEVIVKSVSIGDNVWIGLDVLILPGVEIGEGAVVQAGSVLVFDVPPLAIVGGNPAKPINFRDSNQYYKLKANEKFL